MKIRLNKFLAQCGLGSRRKVEQLIISKRISINGKIIDSLGTQINPEIDAVTLDKKIVHPLNTHLYLVLNKPNGYITTTHDVHNRPIVMDMIPEKYKRLGVFPIGRLDKDTEGLLLFTNDGDLAHKLNHPNFKVTKEYFVEINVPLEEIHKQRIEEGMYLHQLGLKTRPASIKFIDYTRRRLIIKVIEGKKRQIRYTFSNVKYKITKLQRIAYGPITLGNLHRGSLRTLRAKEIKMLKEIVNQ